jgi:hypothetical protein
MQEVVRSRNWISLVNEIDDIRVKPVLDSLENENNQLRKLVVRLSETIIRNVTAKR